MPCHVLSCIEMLRLLIANTSSPTVNAYLGLVNEVYSVRSSGRKHYITCFLLLINVRLLVCMYLNTVKLPADGVVFFM